MRIAITTPGRARRATVALALAVGLGGALAGEATADAAGPIGPLPLSVALTKDELPPVGAWTEPVVKPKSQAGPYLYPTCWAHWLPILPLNETDGVYEYAAVPRPGSHTAPFYNAEILVLRLRDTAAADAIAAEYRSRIASCEIPYPDIANGQLYVRQPKLVANPSGVDVWAYEWGAAGYLESPNTGYTQFFMVQRENVLYFVQITDTKTIEPHPVLPFDATVAAVHRHLAALS